MIIYLIKRVKNYLKINLPVWGRAAAYAIRR